MKRPMLLRTLTPITLGFLLAAAPLTAQGADAVPAGPLTLAQAIALGRERGVSAALSRLSARAVDRQKSVIRGYLLPTLNGSGSITRQTLNLDVFGIPVATGVTDPFTVYQLQLTASQKVFDASLIARLRAASDSAAAAGLDARSVGELSAAAAGLAYLRVLSARETVRARQADSTVAAQLLDIARQQFDAGVSPIIDVTRSEVGLASVRTALEVARNEADRARLDLLRALDLPPGMTLTLADTLAAPAPEIPGEPDAAVRFALEHRPEMLAETSRTRAAERALRAVSYENLPSVSLNGAYTYNGRTTDNLNSSYNVQLMVAVPILDGFRRQNRRSIQSILLDAQRIREQDVARGVETDARKATLDLASAGQQVALASDRLRLAQAELDQAEERFQAGVAGSVETTTAQGSLSQARDALIQARVNLSSARVNAYRALGVLDQMR